MVKIVALMVGRPSCRPDAKAGTEARPTALIIRSRATGEFGDHMPINQELLEILACPKCKGDLRLTEKEDGLICDKCKLLYEIKDDIPIMLIEEAKPLK
jgi:uncharacterized protein